MDRVRLAGCTCIIQKKTNTHIYYVPMGFPGGSVVKNLPADEGEVSSIPGSERSPRDGKWQPTPVFMPGKFH